MCDLYTQETISEPKHFAPTFLGIKHLILSVAISGSAKSLWILWGFCSHGDFLFTQKNSFTFVKKRPPSPIKALRAWPLLAESAHTANLQQI